LVLIETAVKVVICLIGEELKKVDAMGVYTVWGVGETSKPFLEMELYCCEFIKRTNRL